MPTKTKKPKSAETIPTAAGSAPIGAFTELGTSGLKRWGGVLQDEFLTDLQGQKGRKVYREMADNSSVIGAMLFAIKRLLARVKITVNPGGESSEDQRAAMLVETGLQDMSMAWQDTLSDILSMFQYGWSYFEVVYKRRAGNTGESKSRFADGLIGWRKFAIRAQDTLDKWDLDDAGGIRGMVQNDPSAVARGAVTIPIEKALLFRTESNRNSPEGRSLLRNAYVSFYFSKKIRALEGIGVERDSAGIPKITAPAKIMHSAATAADKALFDILKRMGESVRNDEQACVILPSDTDEKGNALYTFDLVSAAGSKQFDTDKILSRYNMEQLIVCLADFILLGHQKVGTQALSEDKTDIFQAAIEGWLDSVLEVLNRYAVPPLLALNGFQLETPPTFVHGPVKAPRLKDFAESIAKLAGAGMPLFPDVELENHLRGLEAWPLVPEDRPDPVDDTPPATADDGEDKPAVTKRAMDLLGMR